MELRPSRVCAWEQDDRGVTLLPPRFGRGPVGRALERWLRPRPYRIRLDAVGTFVWNRCDGSRTVAEIAGQLRDEFGEKVEPAEDRLVSFLSTLLRERFASVDR